jgi:hypothetical protein
MTLLLTPVLIRIADRTRVTAEDEAQTRVLAEAINQEMRRIINAQAALGQGPPFGARLPSA